MKKTIREYLKLAKKCTCREDRVALLQNLLADLIARITAASERSGREIISAMLSSDKAYRDFAKHPDTWCGFRLHTHGFRSCLAAHLVGGDAETKGRFIFEWAKWDWCEAVNSPEPWETIPQDNT